MKSCKDLKDLKDFKDFNDLKNNRQEPGPGHEKTRRQ
jgi:hypothetical protein